MEAAGGDLDVADASALSALQELRKTQESLQQVTSYCSSIYATSDKSEELMESTRKYTSDALQNVVYHVHNVGLQVNQPQPWKQLRISK